jgi:hypothetical protein
MEGPTFYLPRAPDDLKTALRVYRKCKNISHVTVQTYYY